MIVSVQPVTYPTTTCTKYRSLAVAPVEVAVEMPGDYR